MLFLRRRFIIRAKLNLPINYSSLCEKYAFFAFSQTRSTSRAIAAPSPGKSRQTLLFSAEDAIALSRTVPRFRARVCENAVENARRQFSSTAPYPRGLVFIRFAIQSARIPQDIRVPLPAPLSLVVVVPLWYLELTSLPLRDSSK